jgi:hypothetical protein
MKKFLVYTALFGGYDELMDPVEVDDNIEYVCITDNENLRSNVWKFIIDDSDELSAAKNRRYKFLPNLVFIEYDYSLYVDSNIKINRSPYPLMIEMMDYDICIPSHVKRNCVYDEADACYIAKKLKYDEVRLYKQHLKHIQFPRNAGMTENGIIFRRHHSKNSVKWGERVWELYNSLVRRDQLISPLVVKSEGVQITIMPTNAYIKNGIFSYNSHVSHGSKTILEKFLIKIQNLYRQLHILLMNLK